MSNKAAKVSGHARGHLHDPAESWLRQNDPHYASNKRKWSAPTTDALSRALSDTNGPHATLKDLQPVGGGNYLRQAGDDTIEPDAMESAE